MVVCGCKLDSCYAVKQNHAHTVIVSSFLSPELNLSPKFCYSSTLRKEFPSNELRTLFGAQQRSQILNMSEGAQFFTTYYQSHLLSTSKSDYSFDIFYPILLVGYLGQQLVTDNPLSMKRLYSDRV